MMKRTVAAASPDAYASALKGWQRELVAKLRRAVRSSTVDEIIKWRNIVYMSNGPVALIRAEEDRVLLGYWRGKRLVDMEPRLKAGGKYELANIVFREGDDISIAAARRLTVAAIALNAELGDPTNIRAR